MLNIFPQTLCAGDTIPLRLTFTDKATGNPYDLTGAIIGVTVRDTFDDTDTDDTDASFEQDIPGDTTGIVNFYISALTAGDYWLDVKMWATLNGTQVRTTVIAPVQLHVTKSITNRNQ